MRHTRCVEGGKGKAREEEMNRRKVLAVSVLEGPLLGT